MTVQKRSQIGSSTPDARIPLSGPSIAMCCAAGLVAGNYLFQSLNAQHWEVANERSFFQVLAIVAVLIAQRLAGAK